MEKILNFFFVFALRLFLKYILTLLKDPIRVILLCLLEVLYNAENSTGTGGAVCKGATPSVEQ